MAGRNDYEERKQNRIDSYSNRAAQALEKSNTAYSGAIGIIKNIPLGMQWRTDTLRYFNPISFRLRKTNSFFVMRCSVKTGILHRYSIIKDNKKEHFNRTKGFVLYLCEK